MDEIEKYVTELRHAVNAASMNYDVWHALTGEETHPKFVDAMNGYTLYFQTAIHAHFSALLMALYRAHEPRKDTLNVPGLVNTVRNTHPFPEELEKTVLRISAECEPLFRKVAILRNTVFGHKSKKITTKEAFEKAGVTPNELSAIVEYTKELLNEITLQWNQSSHAFNLSAKPDVERLLRDLQELREIRSNK